MPHFQNQNFGAFQDFMQMLSHDKIIFQMLFEAFHVTSRIRIKIFKSYNHECIWRPHLLGEGCFSVIRDLNECITVPLEINES